MKDDLWGVVIGLLICVLFVFFGVKCEGAELTAASGVAYTDENLLQASVSGEKFTASVGVFGETVYAGGGPLLSLGPASFGAEVVWLDEVPNGLSGNFQFKPHIELKHGGLSVNYIHFSNAGTSSPNYGKDFVGLSYSLDF